MTSNIDYQTNVLTGFPKLDEMTAGFQPCDLVIIAGRPSIGKTAFALSIVRNIAVDFGCGVAYFSLEASLKWMYKRLRIHFICHLDLYWVVLNVEEVTKNEI